MSHWQNVPLMKCPIDEMSHWQNIPLTKCPIDKKSHWQNVTLTKSHIDKMSHWQNVTLTKCHIDKMSHWQNATLTKCHIDKMSHWQNGTLTKCHIDEVSRWQNVMSSKCHDDEMTWQLQRQDLTYTLLLLPALLLSPSTRLSTLSMPSSTPTLSTSSSRLSMLADKLESFRRFDFSWLLEKISRQRSWASSSPPPVAIRPSVNEIQYNT